MAVSQDKQARRRSTSPRSSTAAGRRIPSLLLTCAAVLFLDGFDTQAIGYVAPALAKEWHLPRARSARCSARAFRAVIGALVFGPLADRFGRKHIIIFSTVAFGIGAFVTAFVQDLGALLAIRFLTGLGLGGAMPNAIALTSELAAAPPRHHGDDHVLRLHPWFGAFLGGLSAAVP